MPGDGMAFGTPSRMDLSVPFISSRLIWSQRTPTCLLSSATALPNTCGCLRTSFSIASANTSSPENAPDSSAICTHRDRVEQHVPQFFDDLTVIALLDGLHQLVALFQKEVLQ